MSSASLFSIREFSQRGDLVEDAGMHHFRDESQRQGCTGPNRAMGEEFGLQ